MKQELFLVNGRRRAGTAAAAPTSGTGSTRRDPPTLPASPPQSIKARPRVSLAPERLLRAPAAAARQEDALEELRRRADAGEALARQLQAEVERMKTEVARLQVVNGELEEQKRRLADELAAADNKVKILEQNRHAGIPAPPPVIGNAAARGPPPPPPPMQQQRKPKPAAAATNAAALLEVYNSLRRQDAKKGSPSSTAAGHAAAMSSHHSSIVGELQSRSAHLLAIKVDVETRGEFINHLIHKVQSASLSSMEDVLGFIDWLDQQLATLSDERAVLKHFNWPEKKADALREAAFEYRHLRRTIDEVCSVEEEVSTCEAALRKMSGLQDKLEKSMARLTKLRSSAAQAYKELHIPTDWLLDTGVASQLKLASIRLTKAYMKRVLLELDAARGSEKEMAALVTVQEALLAQGVRFAYRVHQFSGGLDAEAMLAFDELRGQVRLQQRATDMVITASPALH